MIYSCGIIGKIIAALILMVSLKSMAAPIIQDDMVVSSRDCFSGGFATYESWLGFMEKKFTRTPKGEKNVDGLIANFKKEFPESRFNHYRTSLRCNTFTYMVDGNPVEGYIIAPRALKEKVPVLVYNRGGNGDFGAVVFGAMMQNLFPISDSGFVIIGSQYRGTFISESKVQDQFGGDDVKDVTALFDIIPKIGGADEKRIGMFGASRGAMQTFLTLKANKNVKAVAAIAVDSDLLTGLQYRPEMENVYKNRIPNYGENKVVELSKRSVLKWIDKIPSNIPILLLHGTEDERVSVQHSRSLAKELDKLKIVHKLVLYEGDDHFLSKNRSESHNEIINWFRKYL